MTFISTQVLSYYNSLQVLSKRIFSFSNLLSNKKVLLRYLIDTFEVLFSLLYDSKSTPFHVVSRLFVKIMRLVLVLHPARI